MARDHDHDNERPRCTGITAGGTRCAKRAIEGTDRCAHHSFRIPGRPTKLTPDVTRTIIAAVLEGNYLETSAQLAGVTPRVLHKWRQRADDLEAVALEHVDQDLDDDVDLYSLVDPAEWVYLDFVHALKSAEAYAEARLLRQAQAGGFGWQAQMTVLERRHPTRWGRRAVLDHTHHGELAVKGKVEHVTPDAKTARDTARILAASGALDLDENPTHQEDPDA
jgi:hypothetical protein